MDPTRKSYSSRFWDGPNIEHYILQDFVMDPKIEDPKIEERGRVLRGQALQREDEMGKLCADEYRLPLVLRFSPLVFTISRLVPFPWTMRNNAETSARRLKDHVFSTLYIVLHDIKLMSWMSCSGANTGYPRDERFSISSIYERFRRKPRCPS